MPEIFDWFWKGMIAAGVGLLFFLGKRTIRINDDEMNKLRMKVHTAYNDIHLLGLEIERFKTEVAREYLRKK